MGITTGMPTGKNVRGMPASNASVKVRVSSRRFYCGRLRTNYRTITPLPANEQHQPRSHRGQDRDLPVVLSACPWCGTSFIAVGNLCASECILVRHFSTCSQPPSWERRRFRRIYPAIVLNLCQSKSSPNVMEKETNLIIKK